MKVILFSGIGLITAVGAYVHGPIGEANVYAMPTAQAYEKLATTDIQPSNTGPFGRLDTVTGGDGKSSVTWTASGSHAHIECSATIAPAEEKSRVDVSCGGGGPSDGAAAGMAMKLTRNALIEHIDATLTGRPYDPDLARGPTAGRWPEDVVHHAGYAEAVSQAHQMDAETRAEIEKIDQAPTTTSGQPSDGWGADTPAAQ
jgi:hypothetical protein